MARESKGYWAEARNLIVEDGASLPSDVCVLTGTPATRREYATLRYRPLPERLLSWVIPFMTITSLRRVAFSHGVSEAVVRDRARSYAFFLGGVTGGGVLLTLASVMSLEFLWLVGVMLIVISMLVSARVRPRLRLVWIVDDRATLAVDRAVLVALGLEEDDEHEHREVATRQSAATRITELEGTNIQAVVGVAPGDEHGLLYAYLKANGAWFRFYVEEGVLFFSPSPGPSHDRDFDPNEDRWVDVYDPSQDAGPTISRVEFADSTVEIELVGGETLRLVENPSTQLLERVD